MTKIDQLAGQQAGQQNFSDFQERTVSEPLFKGAHQALTYAFNYSSGTLDRPAMVKMADRTPRTGRGLAGVDGAAQAGFILRELQALAPLHQRILEARFLPQTTPCPAAAAASGTRTGSPQCAQSPTWPWHAACCPATSYTGPCGTGSSPGTSWQGQPQPRAVCDLAVHAGISERTVTDQNGKITLWLRGSRVVRKGAGVVEEGRRGRGPRHGTGRIAVAGRGHCRRT